MHIIASLVKDGFFPFAFGSRANLELLHPSPFGEDLLMLPDDDPEHLRFHGIHHTGGSSTPDKQGRGRASGRAHTRPVCGDFSDDDDAVPAEPAEAAATPGH